MNDLPYFVAARSEIKEPLFANTTFKEKFLIVLIAIPTYIWVMYVILRAIFDKKKRQEWINASDPDFVAEDSNPRPGEDASDEEWDAYYRAEDAALDEWEKTHRVSTFFFNASIAVLGPAVTFYEWLSRRRDKR